MGEYAMHRLIAGPRRFAYGWFDILHVCTSIAKHPELGDGEKLEEGEPEPRAKNDEGSRRAKCGLSVVAFLVLEAWRSGEGEVYMLPYTAHRTRDKASKAREQYGERRARDGRSCLKIEDCGIFCWIFRSNLCVA